MARASALASRSRAGSKPARGKAESGRKPPPFQPVQLAALVDTVPAGSRWLHEMKYDGYRLLVAVGGGKVRAYTRSGLDWSEKFAGIVKAAAALKVKSALIDGEAVVLDANGKSSFQALQGALKGAPGSIDYYAFDLLELDGEDLTGLPLTERKAKLRALLPEKQERLRSERQLVQANEQITLRSPRLMSRTEPQRGPAKWVLKRLSFGSLSTRYRSLTQQDWTRHAYHQTLACRCAAGNILCSVRRTADQRARRGRPGQNPGGPRRGSAG